MPGGGIPDELDVTPTAAANALLRPMIHRFERVMGPIVREWAKKKWGEEQRDDWSLPKWGWHCNKCLGKGQQHLFKKNLNKDWDAFWINEIIQQHLGAFLGECETIQKSDERAAAEMYKKEVHRIGFMRNGLAHSPEPSVAECVAGAMSVRYVLGCHTNKEDPILKELDDKVNLLQRVRDDDDLELSAEHTLVVLESGMQHFAHAMGEAIHGHYHQAYTRPSLPMAVAGKHGKRKSICNVLLHNHVKSVDQHGKNPALSKSWPAYGKWNWNDSEPALKAIEEARHGLNHGRLDTFDAKRIRGVLSQMLTLHQELELKQDRLQKLCDAAERLIDSKKLKVRVSRSRSEGIVVQGTRTPHASSSDPRTYLVGRVVLVGDVVRQLRKNEWCREVLHGESGVGKTVAAMRIMQEVHGDLPWQYVVIGSSIPTLRSELARFARTHAPHLPADVEEDELVEAAQGLIASGWLLLVDDVVEPDLKDVLVRAHRHTSCHPPLLVCSSHACVLCVVVADADGRKQTRRPRPHHDDLFESQQRVARGRQSEARWRAQD